MKKIVITFLIIIYSGIMLKSQNVENLKAINSDVWEKFYKAFEKLDYKFMAEIHSKDLIRIPGDQKRILDYETYINRYKVNFKADKDNKVTLNIELRFFERFITGDKACERGIFMFTMNKGTDKERKFYGKFHVLHIKEGGKWKILMDYDSNENGTIGLADYNKAFAIDNLDKFK